MPAATANNAYPRTAPSFSRYNSAKIKNAVQMGNQPSSDPEQVVQCQDQRTSQHGQSKKLQLSDNSVTPHRLTGTDGSIMSLRLF